MSRYTGPRVKLSRKVGQDLGLKSNALKTAKRLAIRPGQHGAKGRRKLSDYATQLNEKQKLRYIYGITEKYLRKMYEAASTSAVATGEQLLSSLERRLDNTVYRLGWANTRAAARQLVSHGHILVNGKRLTIPSYQVQVDDVINLTPGAMNIPLVSELLKDEGILVEWLDRKQAVGKVSRLPQRADVREGIEEQLIIEYYSR